ncbi:MAG: MaoC family dehydratase [Acidobacteria bacterium]|nr:MaoC family dehydratase [Acidobacteriota bacterium]
MAKTVLKSIDDLEAMIGTEVAVSDWVEVTQSQIEQFANATGDRQWIHLDVERAGTESPFGGTIAHGFLTLSLLSMLVSESIGFSEPPRLTINYGLNRVRFVGPVRAGTRIRSRIVPQNLELISAGLRQLSWMITIEREGEERPAAVAEWLIRYYD